MRNDSRRLRLAPANRISERIATAAICSIAGGVALSLLWIVGDLVGHGISGVKWSYIVESPTRAGRGGGIAPILVSTMLILGIAMGVAIPIGMSAAIWLSEFSRCDGMIAVLVSRSLDVLAAVPSIVFGLFGNAVFCSLFGLGYSILAGGLTLACMVLPILVRSVEASLRSVPDNYRLAAAALGISRTRTAVSVLLPAASAGVVVGLVLGIGRVLAETAALLFTSGYVDRMPRSVTDSGRALSVHIYDLSMNIPGGTSNAYTSALLLVGILVILNLATSIIVRACLGGGNVTR